MNYLKQAKEFLRKNELSLLIRLSVPQMTPLWAEKGEDHGLSYWVELLNRKNGESYSFAFWDSIDARNKNEKPNAYDVLACIDTFSDGDSFEDFCSNFGYDTDSRKAEKIYKSIMKQIEGLRRVLSAKEIEELNEIN